MDLFKLSTEKSNQRAEKLDMLTVEEMAELMNDEDQTVAYAVKKELKSITRLIELGIAALKKQGRIFYVGAGTSGRLGVLDASEIPPTFNTTPEQFNGIIAGGYEALYRSKPIIEDDVAAGASVLEPYNLTSSDLVIGLAASGRTPFVQGAVEFAKQRKAKTGLICCNKQAKISPLVDVAVEIETGPEVILGSTRLKAGTAQKMALNIFSTVTMANMGKVYKNLMVDFNVTNKKLVDRAIRVIQEATGVETEEAKEIFEQTQNVKVSIIHILTGASPEESRKRLELHRGKVRDVLDSFYKNS